MLQKPRGERPPKLSPGSSRSRTSFVSQEIDRASLPPGPARFRADESGLDIEVTGADGDALARAKFIVEDHLLRFAFREKPGALTWSA